MTDKQRFYRLLSEVCEDLPTKSINAVVAAGYQVNGEAVNAVTLMHVRQGRIINLPHLIALVEAGMPDFLIPAELRPVVSARVPAPLFQ